VNGAESALRTAAHAGIDVCFANPGTTELPFVAALEAVGAIRPVLGLFEGVCTGAADGYGRMTGRPALTLLHLGPGLANGLANLHNARRARTPVVNLVGDHATWHLAADPPLASDITSLARTVSTFVRTTRSASELSGDVAAAVAAACEPPGGVATLVVPADCQWEEAPGPPATPSPATGPAPVSEDAVGVAAKLLTGGSAVLLLGGPALHRPGLMAAGRVARATGCRLISEGFPARMERGAGLPPVERMGYFPEQVLGQLSGVTGIVLAGAAAPVAFFGYPSQPSSLVPTGADVCVLASPDQEVVGGLEALADALDAPNTGLTAELARPERPTGELSVATLGATVAHLLPEGAVVVDEAATSGVGYHHLSATAAPHTCLGLTGGAIGQGLPVATGAALACPDRPVVALQADGSAAYTLQALWTQARQSLDVTTVLCNNRSYRILQIEMARSGLAPDREAPAGLTDLSHPDIGWARLAEGFGVPAVSVDSADGLCRHLEAALGEGGPHLIEARL